MIDKLEAIKVRFDEVSKLIVDPDVISDMKKYIKLNKEYKDLDIIVSVYNNYKNIISNIDSAKKILNEEDDIELKEMAKSEIDLYLSKKQELEQEIKILLIPKDPNDDRNAVVEIVAGTGGDEASKISEETISSSSFVHSIEYSPTPPLISISTDASEENEQEGGLISITEISIGSGSLITNIVSKEQPKLSVRVKL